MDAVGQIVSAIIARANGVQANGGHINIVLPLPGSGGTGSISLPELVSAVSRAMKEAG